MDAYDRKSASGDATRDKGITLARANFATLIDIPPRHRPKQQAAARRATELDFQFDNIRSILRCSNSTPISRLHGGLYVCGYCPDGFPTPGKLKQHTLEAHGSDKPECLRTPSLSKYIVLLDVTALACRLCDDVIRSLPDLMRHLESAHAQPIHTDVKSHLVLLDLPERTMRCPQCGERFADFEALVGHASSHNRNYPCELCVDRWFVNKHLMMEHKRAVHFFKPRIAYIEITAEPIKRASSEGERPRRVQILLRKKNELDLHMSNLKVILDNSNATTIRCRGGVGYACCFCDEQYPDPADLKRHTTTHRDVFESSFMKSQAMPTLLIKLDITGLRCSNCGEQLPELEDLLAHLESEHGVQHHRGIDSHIVPFRFDGDALHCVVCKRAFSNFKVLLEHMNTHYRNHVCGVCGAGFVNRRIAQMHGYRHPTGVHRCSYCAKVFDNRVKLRAHERAVHVCLNKRSRCGHCGERFSDYTKKREHEVSRHGAKPLVLACCACERTFDNQRTLSHHVKTYHLMGR
ncbi:unnamed protein product, partial [Iphiclides podalirius]